MMTLNIVTFSTIKLITIILILPKKEQENKRR
jgi:hypothetical protein